MAQRYVKPARKGLMVRRPENGRPLPEEGGWVTWGSYWMRRKAEGSVVEAKPPKKRTPAAESNKEGSE